MMKYSREQIQAQIDMLKKGTGCNNTQTVISMLEEYMRLQEEEGLYEMVNKYSGGVDE